MAKKILITGGAGYIGSHTALELLNEGYEVVVYDNLCNSSKESLKRVEELTGKTITFYEGDVMDEAALKAMLEKEGVDAVIHCAALKAVGESVQKPLEYYRNNITGTLTLMDVMKQTGVKNIVFSSSATVYGSPEEMPITEECPKGQCTNPYGWTKSMMEQIMTDVQKANPDMNVILLRYFNPVGAHESGRIGEDPKGIPNNLMPYISQVAVGKLEKLGVFGDDYDTPDGTGVRDYIHVVDLAKGHVKAIDYIFSNPGLDVINLGTGVGYFAILLYGKGLQVTGIDLTPDMIERAEVLADRYGADVNFKVMDAMNLEYEDESFDVVITRNLTWTLPDVDKAYKEWHRVLRKGGVLLNYDANYANMKNLDATLIDDDKKEEPYGHQGMTYALEAENAYITKAMDIGRHQRPEYDISLLEKNGFNNCSADKVIGEKLLKEKDIKEAPMFLITAYR